MLMRHDEFLDGQIKRLQEHKLNLSEKIKLYKTNLDKNSCI